MLIYNKFNDIDKYLEYCIIKYLPSLLDSLQHLIYY